MAKYIMALDAGTTSNRCILFNEKGEMIKGKITIDGKEYNFNNRGELI